MITDICPGVFDKSSSMVVNASPNAATPTKRHAFMRNAGNFCIKILMEFCFKHSNLHNFLHICDRYREICDYGKKKNQLFFNFQLKKYLKTFSKLFFKKSGQNFCLNLNNRPLNTFMGRKISKHIDMSVTQMKIEKRKLSGDHKMC